MRVWVLGSGSRGNAVLLEAGDSRVLIDAGFPSRVLGERLVGVGVAPESVEAVVLTHEHHDHARGATTGARKWGWCVYATAGTIRVSGDLDAVDARAFNAGETVVLNRIDVRTVRTPHDAAESVAVVATDQHTGARVGIVYDLGHPTATLRNALRDLDVLVLEANHDEGMLNAGPYPPSVRDRIAGARGHLSNRDASRLARDSVHRGLGHIVLAHLSESCNDGSIARRTVAACLSGTAFRGVLSCTEQDRVSGPFVPRVRRATVQLGLGL